MPTESMTYNSNREKVKCYDEIGQCQALIKGVTNTFKENICAFIHTYCESSPYLRLHPAQ